MSENSTEQKRKERKRKRHDDSHQQESEDEVLAKVKIGHEKIKKDVTGDSPNTHNKKHLAKHSHSANSNELQLHNPKKHKKHKFSGKLSQTLNDDENLQDTNTTSLSLKVKVHVKTDNKGNKQDNKGDKQYPNTETKLLQKLTGVNKNGKGSDSIIDKSGNAKKQRKNVFRMENTAEKDASDDDGIDPEKAEIRRKKREKRKEKKLNKQNKLVEEPSEKSGAVRDSAIQYLHQWDSERSQWKFQKVRQVWLLQNMFSQELISDTDFEILLRYLEDLKGKSRETTVTEAEKVLKQAENVGENEGAYKEDRSRRIIQLLC